jgi:hypothetical protein
MVTHLFQLVLWFGALVVGIGVVAVGAQILWDIVTRRLGDFMSDVSDRISARTKPLPPPPPPLPVFPDSASEMIMRAFDVPEPLRKEMTNVVAKLLEDAKKVPGATYDQVEASIHKAFKIFIEQLPGYSYSNECLKPSRTPLLAPAIDIIDRPFPSFVVMELPYSLFPKLRDKEQKQWDKWEKSKREPRTNREKLDKDAGGTAIERLYEALVPFTIDPDTKFSGTHVVAPPGRGKTTLLNGLIYEQLEEVAGSRASLILMDSKNDPRESLIGPWRNVDFEKINPRFRDCVHVIDPDMNVAINIMDLGSVTQTIELLEYVFSSILGSTTTPLQSTLFRSVVIATKATPNPSLATLRNFLRQGWKPYEEYIRKLDPEDQEFFLAPGQDGKSDFDSRTYADTRNQLAWRLKDLTDRAPVLRPTLRCTQSKIDLRRLIDEGGHIIIINAKTGVLGDMGSEFWQRLWVAFILAAARSRTSSFPSCTVIIDEAHKAIARDEKIISIVDECRSAGIAVVLSHQGASQLTPPVRDALERCAIKFVNDGRLPIGKFSADVRDQTDGPITVSVKRFNPKSLPQLSPDQAEALRQDMRARYGAVLPAESEPAPVAASRPSEAFAVSADPAGRAAESSAEEAPRAQAKTREKAAASDTPAVGLDDPSKPADY